MYKHRPITFEVFLSYAIIYEPIANFLSNILLGQPKGDWGNTEPEFDENVTSCYDFLPSDEKSWVGIGGGGGSASIAS